MALEARGKVTDSYEGEKNHKKGGLNCVFQNFFFYVQELFSGSESERGSESD